MVYDKASERKTFENFKLTRQRSKTFKKKQKRETQRERNVYVKLDEIKL